MTRFAVEYGGALFELACDEQISDQIMTELRQLITIFEQEKDYLRLLDACSIGPDVRKGLIDEALGGSVHPYLINFMKLLIDRGAIEYLPECAAAYRARYNEMKGIVEAQVSSATPLSQAQVEALRARLSEISGKQVEMHLRVDPELIGGVCVDLQGRRYDNTVRTRLEQLRRNLMEQE